MENPFERQSIPEKRNDEEEKFKELIQESLLPKTE